MSHQYNLKTLRKYGYKTFHPHINEDYDTVDTLQKRAQEIVQELKRLSELPENKLEELYYDKLKPICNHNLNVLLNRSFHKEFYNLLDKIKRY